MTDAEALDELWIADRFFIGEICVRIIDEGIFCLTHRDDENCDELAENRDAAAASEIARCDDAGKYRPLKTAPTLRHGWALRLPDRESLTAAIEGFYPGRLSAYAAWKSGELQATPFRETLGRQTGMYRASAKITDGDADTLIRDVCRSDGGCLRTILWRRDAAGAAPSTLLPAEKYDPAFDQTGRRQVAAPLFCQEICNILVAAAREVAKAPAPA